MTADGVGAYILAAGFSGFLAHAVGGKEETFDWGALKEQLPMPWASMMTNEQMTEGKKFEESVKNLTNLVMEASVCIFPNNDRIHSLKYGA